MSGEEAPPGALNLAEYAPAGARTVDCFRRIRKIGEGTYGQLCYSCFFLDIVVHFSSFICSGLHYCHANNVLHRDIKGANLLISGDKLLKIADFGLARPFTRDGSFTNHVITLWYRPPELLLGATNYAEAVDIWSVGCIFAEFLLRKPLFPGRTEQEQLSKIFELCGYPNEDNWPGASKLPLYKTIHPATPTKRRVRDILKNFDCHAVELIDRMLILNPSQRISAHDALSATYFIHYGEET
uniref:Uncharacterized protein n=1 Tax=Avena sativa TaxID=4498 RepID=A0ACD5ZY31_AVESA